MWMSSENRHIWVAIMGMVLVGGISAILAVTALRPPTPAPIGNVALDQTPTSSLTTTATAMPTVTAQSTPTPRPTRTVRPTPTLPTSGPADVHGSIRSINVTAGTFGYRITTGARTTIITTTQTQFTGAATSLSGLQVGWLAEVVGTYQPNGTVLATLVNSSLNT
jgi:hypothetical protein